MGQKAYIKGKFTKVAHHIDFLTAVDHAYVHRWGMQHRMHADTAGRGQMQRRMQSDTTGRGQMMHRREPGPVATSPKTSGR